mgnify:FL=1|jgi:hypothetical protein|tara:strand:+ start:79 stop:603 length:525 start_codon:yes stop_codon:yes gene_type:complete
MDFALEKSSRGKNLEIAPPVKINVPRSHVPYGFSIFQTQNEYQKPSVSLQLLINNDETISTIRELEATVIERVSKMYDGKVDGSQFNSNFKNGRLRVKYNDQMTSLFDSNGKKLYVEIEDNSYQKWSAAVTATVEGVYFMNQQFGLIWKANQVKLFEPTQVKGYCFLSDSDDDN